MEVSVKNDSCHGELECLYRSSSHRIMGPVARLRQRLRSYGLWWVENLGWRATLKHTLVIPFQSRSGLGGGPGLAAGDERLDLQPGEMVEVKTVEEVLATLDGNRRHKGLLWMTGMRKYCGTRRRVYRKVEKIMLESNGQLRAMKHTVLLEGAMCDGRAFGGCDRSCFHFWREGWLKRVPEQERGPGVP